MLENGIESLKISHFCRLAVALVILSYLAHLQVKLLMSRKVLAILDSKHNTSLVVNKRKP